MTETNAIFENIRQVNAEADANITTLRISIDTKATVNVGEYSRAGRSRGTVAVKALDHDMCHKKKLVPGGILEPVTGWSFLFFGSHFKTSDFMVVGRKKEGAVRQDTEVFGAVVPRACRTEELQSIGGT